MTKGFERWMELATMVVSERDPAKAGGTGNGNEPRYGTEDADARFFGTLIGAALSPAREFSALVLIEAF